MNTICNIPLELPTAPELIQDMLIATGTALPVKTVCRAGALVGVRESAIRVALNRLVEQKKITHSARGFYAMNLSQSALARRIDTWQQEAVRTVPWDRSWLGVADTAVLRSDKTAWRHHNLALSLYGFRPLQAGLHVRPNNLAGSVDAVRSQLAELGLSGHSMVFRLDSLDAARQKNALSLWEVDGLTSDYLRNQQALRTSTRNLKSADLDTAVRESLLLGRAVIGALLRDPLLPAEIAPVRFRAALTEDMQNYHANARQYWLQWLAA